MQMRDTIPLPVTTTIRAAAYILKKHTACEMATEVAKKISDTLTPCIIEHVVGAIAPQMAKLLTTSDLLLSTLDRTEAVRKALANDRDEMDDRLQISATCIETVANELHASVEDCQNALKLLSPSLDTTQKCLNTLSTQLLTQHTPTQHDNDNVDMEIGTTQNQRQTYSSIVAANLTPSIDKAIRRAAICAREILLDPTPGNNLFPPDTQHADMVKKMKAALTNICKPDTPVGDIRSVTMLHNGSFIIELETESLASWLHETTSKEALIAHFRNTVSFRTCTYPIIAEYLPIQLQIQETPSSAQSSKTTIS
ncbi:hypothetical protein BDR07DRAFT_1502152 [Suillus spraguei]|nr:hypothetical protein BDR07DRAFT_1502152 [Suillus spraguei]